MANGITADVVISDDHVIIRRTLDGGGIPARGVYPVLGTFWMPRAEWDEFVSSLVQEAMNKGINLTQSGLQLGDRDCDLLNIAGNAVGYAADHPDVTELDDVLNSGWQLDSEQEEEYKDAAAWVRSWWDW